MTDTPIQNAENSLNVLERLVKELEEVRTKADYHELQMGEWNKKERELAEQVIPSLMGSLGYKKDTLLPLPSGATIELKEQVFARIPVDKKQEAFDWLRDNDEGGMIKEEVVTSVHPQTLKAWVRGKLEEGVELPQDLFSIFVQKVAKTK
jgi:hypothetical protein